MWRQEMAKSRERSYQIGEVSKASGTSIPTIRYYETLGLLDKPARSEGGFRLYSEKTIQQIDFIRKAQAFGLSLNEIKRIIEQSRKGLGVCCNYVNEVLESKLAELELKIKNLQETKKNLRRLMSHWMPMQEAKKKDFAVCPQIEIKTKKTRKL
jgi:DNA-binding transcriptional MerR regulator